MKLYVVTDTRTGKSRKVCQDCIGINHIEGEVSPDAAAGAGRCADCGRTS